MPKGRGLKTLIVDLAALAGFSLFLWGLWLINAPLVAVATGAVIVILCILIARQWRH